MKTHSIGFVVLLAGFVFLTSVASPTYGDDWPQWRGPNRDGAWKETGIIEKFAAEKTEPLWEAEISSGYSGPTVADGKVYVTDRVVTPEQIERVHCFDATTGKVIWMHSYPCIYRNVGYQAGPRASVSLDNGKAYALGTMGNFYCLDASNGRIIWEHDLNEKYKIRMPIWGIAASPIIVGDLIIVQIGGSPEACLVAFDKTSGKEKWKALSDNASYAAPILIQQAGKQVLVCWTGNNVVGLNPSTGEAYWKHSFKPQRMVISIATPVFDENRLFVTSFYDGSLLLNVNPETLSVTEAWQRVGKDERNTDALQSIMATPYLEDDYIYGVDSYGELRCLEVMTGDRVWESLKATPKARWSNIHMVRNAENTWMFNERGDLIISKLSPKGYEEISRTNIIQPTTAQLNQRKGVCWAHPAFANRHVFVRNDEKLICVSLERQE